MNIEEIFDINIVISENKINLSYFGSEEKYYDIYVKDIDSKATLYYSKTLMIPNYNYFIIPTHPAICDFQTNLNFGGVLLEFYDDNTFLFNHEIRIRDTQPKRECLLHTKDPIYRNYEDFFVDKIYDNFINSISNKDVCVDIGANVGLFTDLALSNGFKKVLSVEPNPKAINDFKQLHKDNSNVELVEYAITSNNKDVLLSCDENNTLCSSLYVIQTDNFITVPSKTIDELLRDYDKIDLLKMDIEGGEYDIFEHIKKETLMKIDNLLLEFHYNDGNSITLLKLISKLVDMGEFNSISIKDTTNKEHINLIVDQGIIIAQRNI